MHTNVLYGTCIACDKYQVWYWSNKNVLIHCDIFMRPRHWWILKWSLQRSSMMEIDVCLDNGGSSPNITSLSFHILLWIKSLFFGQPMSPHNSDYMFQGSQVSMVVFFKSVSVGRESVSVKVTYWAVWRQLRISNFDCYNCWKIPILERQMTQLFEKIISQNCDPHPVALFC